MAQIMNIELKSTTEAGPVYLQVRNQIEARIRDKQIASGATLPSPAQIAQQLNVDSGEIKRAYHELELNGLIKKSVGKNFLGEEKTTYSVK